MRLVVKCGCDVCLFGEYSVIFIELVVDVMGFC